MCGPTFFETPYRAAMSARIVGIGTCSGNSEATAVMNDSRSRKLLACGRDSMTACALPILEPSFTGAAPASVGRSCAPRRPALRESTGEDTRPWIGSLHSRRLLRRRPSRTSPVEAAAPAPLQSRSVLPRRSVGFHTPQSLRPGDLRDDNPGAEMREEIPDGRDL